MNLKGFRDYDTDDSEEYWDVKLAHAIEAIMGELSSWPIARLLIPDTGEIKEGSLMYLLDDIATAVSRGGTVTIESIATQTAMWVCYRGHESMHSVGEIRLSRHRPRCPIKVDDKICDATLMHSIKPE